jgi:prepilin-type processing-associated H-X9-DG protein
MSEQIAKLLASLSHRWLLELIALPVASGLVMHYAGVRLARAKERADRRARRIAAVTRAMSLVILVCSLPLLTLAFSHFGCAALVSHSSRCRSNLKQLATAVLMYAQDYDERMPPATDWASLLAPHLKGSDKDVFHCPATEAPGSYGMNSALSGVRQEDIDQPARTVMLFEVDAPTRSFAGGANEMARHRHSGAPNVCYADGHCMHANEYTQQKLLWRPKQTKK